MLVYLNWMIKVIYVIIGFLLASYVSKKIQKVIPREKYFSMSIVMIGLVLITSLAAILTIFQYLPNINFPINQFVSGLTLGILLTFWIRPNEK